VEWTLLAHGSLVEAVEAVHALHWRGLANCGGGCHGGWGRFLDEFPSQSATDVLVLTLVLVVLCLGFDEAIFGRATSFLEGTELLVELSHFGLSFVHEVIVLVDLLLEGLKDALLDAGALETTDVVSGDAQSVWWNCAMLVLVLVLVLVLLRAHGLRHAALLGVGAWSCRGFTVGLTRVGGATRLTSVATSFASRAVGLLTVHWTGTVVCSGHRLALTLRLRLSLGTSTVDVDVWVDLLTWRRLSSLPCVSRDLTNRNHTLSVSKVNFIFTFTFSFRGKYRRKKAE
jgi:hypothetical protein